MRKVIKKVALFSLPLFVACGSKEPVNEAPTVVNLVYPTQNLLCIDNSISFDWSDATDPNKDKVSYKVEIAKNRELTNIAKTQTANTSQATIILEKDVAYYWRVTAIDSKGKESEPSSVFAFYTKAEGESNIAPFTAELVKPVDESAVDGLAVTLEWKGADSNTGDTLTYDVYFGEDAIPTTIKEEGISVTSIQVTVESGKTYYWKVNTIDNAGAKSIGQVWSFKVN
ncbi:fibronectin type III domain-containing protein [Tenacibaculum caenipelagi]|uniref:Fibronectin type-III domain-containing protein n=1 Tax=Tenacibaculum caenipelagi TaxID=1325435 RepID=A0A4R6THH7_9FLAO|nr:hypothetical protein [Tenacibaculum caenipelagi]TDQ28626.1 hypothetical protein DFQ07_1003 [Tenacibaculum caenipelagi]